MPRYKSADGNRDYTLVYRAICDDQRLPRCEVGARFLFVLMLTWTDNRGRTLADPDVVRSRCFPREPEKLTHVSRWLKELHEQGLLYLYMAKGQQYAFVPMFNEYNPIRGNMRTVSDLPSPDREGLAQWCEQHGKDERVILPLLESDTRLNVFKHVQTSSNTFEEKNRISDTPLKAEGSPLPDDRQTDMQVTVEPQLSGDADVDAISRLFTETTNNRVGTKGLEQIRFRLSSGWSVGRLSSATRTIVWKAKEKPRYFSYVNASLDEWGEAHPAGEEEVSAHDKEVASRAIKRRQDKEDAEQMRAAGLIASLTEEERTALMEEASAIVVSGGIIKPESKLFEVAVHAKMRSLVIERSVPLQVEEDGGGGLRPVVPVAQMIASAGIVKPMPEV